MTSESTPPSDTGSPLERISVLRALTSVPVLTLALLITTDVLLRFGDPVDALGFKSVDLWNLPSRIELCKRTNPDLALLGSSLILVLSQANKIRHYSSGNFPPYLQERLREVTGKDVTCVNLCSGLQMPAEAYLIAEAITDQPDYPRVLLCGLTLRDFIDRDFVRESNLTAFQSVAPYVPLNSRVFRQLEGSSGSGATAGAQPKAEDAALRELILCHFWYLYRDRTGFKSMFSAIIKDWLENFPLDQSFVRLGPDHLFRPQRYGFLPETWVPRKVEKFTEAMYQAHPELVKTFELSRQAAIYSAGSEETRAVQIRYLEALVSLCKAKGIKTVIVNLPLSPELLPLIPTGLNDACRGYLRALESEKGIAYIDLFADPQFNESLFKDGVHLNYTGSCLLADRIVADLKQSHPDVLEALSQHAAARAQNAQLKAKHEAPYTLEHLYD